MKHTPLPWRVGDAGHTVFGPPTGEPSPKTIAGNLSGTNARFIVRACNSHEELVEAARDALAALGANMNPTERVQIRSVLRAAIRKAEGE